jgi:hypothetical protein
MQRYKELTNNQNFCYCFCLPEAANAVSRGAWWQIDGTDELLFEDRRDRRTKEIKEDRRNRRTDEALLDDYFIAVSEKKSMFFCCALIFFVSLPKIHIHRII